MKKLSTTEKLRRFNLRNKNVGAALILEGFSVSLFRKNGELVESIQVDSLNEQHAKRVFYIDCDIVLLDGDYLSWEVDEEVVSEKEYNEIGMMDRVLSRY